MISSCTQSSGLWHLLGVGRRRQQPEVLWCPSTQKMVLPHWRKRKREGKWAVMNISIWCQMTFQLTIQHINISFTMHHAQYSNKLCTVHAEEKRWMCVCERERQREGGREGGKEGGRGRRGSHIKSIVGTRCRSRINEELSLILNSFILKWTDPLVMSVLGGAGY